MCPDYEHVRISENLYKYTFEKLNDGYGLIGKKLLKIIEDVHILLKKKILSLNIIFCMVILRPTVKQTVKD